MNTLIENECVKVIVETKSKSQLFKLIVQQEKLTIDLERMNVLLSIRDIEISQLKATVKYYSVEGSITLSHFMKKIRS